MRKTLLFIILLVAVNVSAQVPGYLGKKFLLGINYQYSPAYGSLLLGDDYGGKRTAGSILLPSPKLSLEFKTAVSEQSTFDLSLAHQVVHLVTDYEDREFMNTVYYDQIKTSMLQVSAGYSKHTQHVAPVGFYAKGAGSFMLFLQEVQRSNQASTTRTFFDLGWTQGFGTRRVIADRLALDMGLDFNLNVIGLVSLLGNFSSGAFEDGLKYHILVTNSLNNLVVVRMGAYYLF